MIVLENHFWMKDTDMHKKKCIQLKKMEEKQKIAGKNPLCPTQSWTIPSYQYGRKQRTNNLMSQNNKQNFTGISNHLSAT